MEIGEGVDRHSPEPPRNKKRIKVRVSLFFDGTGNNRVNTGLREQNTWRYWWMKRAIPGPTESYENDRSNVARLAENLDVSAQGYDAYVRVYTSGIGTTDADTDDRQGLGTGTGLTGIESKVTQGVSVVLHRLTKRYSPEDFVIELVSVDTCGFSRGAAAARHCVYRVLNDRQARVQAQLERAGYEVGRVEVLAVGLFDTVSSHGWSLKAYDDNVATLHLDAVRQAAHVYQLAAAEEYRERFSLTNIESAGGRGRQVYLPGAHSDIGGGYRDGAGEDGTLVEGPAAHDVGRFLLANGWYRAGAGARELEYTASFSGTTSTPYGPTSVYVPARVSARRAAIARAYTFIPLRLMADWFKGQGVAVKKVELYAAYNPGAVPGRARIEAYAKSVGASKPSDWEGSDHELAAMRHGYLHVSFSTGIGMAVRLSGNHRPYRHVYHG